MQHYGIPTRLFDRSENLGIAKFFAANYRGTSNKEENAAIHVLDSLALDQYSGLTDVSFVPGCRLRLHANLLEH
jgi:hypothetical protein